MKRRDDPVDRPLDRTLIKLLELFPDEQVYRAHPLKLDTWVARCPICQNPHVFTLEIVELPMPSWSKEEYGGEVRFDCWSDCPEQLIRLSLGTDVPLTLRRAA